MTRSAEITLVRARQIDVRADASSLSFAERVSAAKLAPLAARAFVAGRALLRRSLGRALATDPRALALGADDNGRPRLETACGIDFNLSHGGAWIVIAIAHGCRVGIDVEPRHPTRDVDAIVDALGLLPACDVDFATRWSRIEATCKLTGRGLTVPIDPPLTNESRGITVVDLHLDDAHAAALAWSGETPPVLHHVREIDP